MDAVILAGGEGTRLKPLTITRPKPMLPVGGKPILEWCMKAVRDGGIKKIIVVVGYKKEEIIDYFGNMFEGIPLEYVEQKEQLGTGHAISLVEHKVSDDFIVVNGDLIISPERIKTVVKMHNRYDSDATISLIHVSNPADFGVVEMKNDFVTRIVEKPKRPRSNLANAGVYVFNHSIFGLLKEVGRSKRGEYEITDALQILANQKKVRGFESKCVWIDIGRPWDLLDANEILLKEGWIKFKHEGKIEKYTTIKGNVHIGEGTEIKSGAYIEGPVFIGKNCNIGPNCYIRPYTSIGNNVHIGNAVEIKNSIIMSNTNIAHLSYVGDSIIAERCNFGAGTKIANLRFDEKDVKVRVKGELKESGRKKFGAILGDGVKTGINVSIMPGISIYPDARVEADTVVRNTIYSERI